MVRAILGVVLGVVVWVVVVTVLNFGLRAMMPGLHEAEATFAFTLPMLAGRLVESALATLAGGAVARLIAPSSRYAPIALGVLLTALFVPLHISLWDKFPLWYHLTFLVSLLPLTLLGGMLVRRKA